jgi:uncharacterized protein YchJ
VKRAWLSHDAEGFVEFIARNRPAGGRAAQRLHELSRFHCDRNTHRWQYVDGVVPDDDVSKV